MGRLLIAVVQIRRSPGFINHIAWDGVRVNIVMPELIGVSSIEHGDHTVWANIDDEERCFVSGIDGPEAKVTGLHDTRR